MRARRSNLTLTPARSRGAVAVALALAAMGNGWEVRGQAEAEAEAGPVVRVTGIVCLGPMRQALLEIQPARPGRPVVKPILGVGEKTEGVELVSIDERQGVVVTKQAGVIAAVSLPDGAPGTEPRSLHFAGAELSQVLEIYQQVAERTVVRAGGLSSARISLRPEGTLSGTEAAKALEAALNQQGLLALPVGEKFVCITPASGIAQVNELPPLRELDGSVGAPGGGQGRPDDPEALPPGMIKFQDVDLNQVLEIYQELSGRTVLLAPQRADKITVKSQNALSRAEACWMLEIALQMNGTRMVRDGQKFVFALPVALKAPPDFQSNASMVPKEKAGLAAGGLRFSQTHLAPVLDVYAEVCGRKAAPGGVLPSARFSVRSQSKLTADEVIYALDALAALQGVEFVAVGDREITARAKTASPRVGAGAP